MEMILDVYWEGPYKWDERAKVSGSHNVLYALYGQHHVYGRHSLLYIGRTSNIEDRLDTHDKWVAYEYDDVELRVASIGKFQGWDAWNKPGNYPPAEEKWVADVESLLILAHQPSYNSKDKGGAGLRDLRIFNTGRPGPLLPEVSSLYMRGA